MNTKKPTSVKESFSQYHIDTDSLMLQKKAATEQGLMLMLFSSVIFALGFSLSLFGRASIEPVASAPVHQPTPLERDIRAMVAGYPIAAMSEEIARHDRRVAAFVIAIAKKESNWGKRVPTLDGKNCYNYWGFREQRERMGTGGHTCFDNPRDAVRSVSERIETLMYEYDRNTPQDMIVWKCGYSCDGHSEASVKKWIRDVDYYFRQLKTERVAQKL
jgi:hypothetical protein